MTKGDTRETFDRASGPGAHERTDSTPRGAGVSSVEFERVVLSRLTALGRRLRAYALTGGLAAALGYLLAAGAVQFALDYTFRLPFDMRAALVGVIVLGLAVLGWRRVWRVWRFPIGVGELACLIEKRHPGLRSVLVSSVRFATGEVGSSSSNSPELMRAVVRRACDAAAGLRFGGVLEHRRARRSLITIVGVVAAVAAAFGLSPKAMGIWFDRNVLLSRETQWPQRTHLEVELPHGVLTGARGDDLEVRARAVGEVPREVSILFESLSGTSGRETMVSVGERGFRYTFTRVEEAFRFRLKGGDDETRWFEAQLADRPRVDRVTIRVAPPAYSGTEAYALAEGQRAIEVLRGSAVTLEVGLNKAVLRAELMSGQERIAEAVGRGDAWSVRLSPTETRTYHFELEDELHLMNKRPVRLSVRVLKDAPPRVRLKVSGVSDVVTTQALLRIEMSFSDTYGLARAEMVYQVSREGSEPQREPLPDFHAGMTQFDTRLSWPVGSVAVTAGDRVALFARAADFNDVSGPGETKSNEVVLRIVTRDELLAELARREQEHRQEFERVIEQQETLRGRLLSLIRELDEPETRRRISARVSPLERRQRQIAGQVNLLRQQFEQILAEMEINGLDSVTVRDRLQGGIVEPMNRLARRDLVAAADGLRGIERDPTAEKAGAADASQAAVLKEMRLILGNMLKWEGFQEAVTMLRDIVRLQKGLRQETQEEIERRAADILGDDK